MGGYPSVQPAGPKKSRVIGIALIIDLLILVTNGAILLTDKC